MKKAICILVSAFLIIAIFIGCGGNSVTPAPAESPAAQSAPAESPAAAEPAPAEKTTINLTSWYRFDSFYTSSLQEALARELPHIELNYEVIPADQYNQVLTTRVLAGAEQAPDIIQVDVGQMFAQFANDGILTDLSNEEFISSYTDVTKAALTHNGKAYGICLEGNGAGFFYNKDVFNAVGVQPPSTFAELLDVCEKIAAAGIAPVGFSGKDAWTLNWFMNPLIANVLAANPNFRTDRYDGNTTFAKDFRPAYAAVQEIIEKGYINRGSVGLGFDQLRAQMFAGEIAMTVQGDWIVGDTISENHGEDVNYGFFSIAFDDGNKGFIYSPATIFTVNAHSKNHDAAMDFIRYLGSYDGSLLFAEWKHCLPARTDITNINLPDAQKEYTAAMSSGIVTTEYIYTYTPASFHQINEKTLQLMLAGEQVDIDEALAEMDAAYDKDKGQLSRP
ncbi:MAG: extracellular solute-binding protein [Oscillospiraceae bacterium]|nr:extracellular solute-binding protein [Oscillospiraceae bacterium]